MHGVALAALALALGSPAPTAESPAQRLSDRQLAGQRVVFAYRGFTPPDALVRRLRRGEAAGVIVFGRNVRSRSHLRRTLGGLERAARSSDVALPPLVMVDQEGGLVRRLPGGPNRSAAQVGATGSLAAAFRDGRRAGAALRGAGANVALAPVVDVCRAAAALEREQRCYGRRPRTVTRFAAAFARGLRARHVAATLKHFPGFGSAKVNTDNAPVTIRTALDRLRARDELPFLALRRHAALVMLSTAVYPALDASRPAVLSRAVVTGELRGRVGFRGVVVSDALDTPAVARYGGPGRLALRATRAGTDLVLYGGSYAAGERAAGTLTRRLRSKALRRPVFVRSVERVLRLRASLRR